MDGTRKNYTEWGNPDTKGDIYEYMVKYVVTDKRKLAKSSEYPWRIHRPYEA